MSAKHPLRGFQSWSLLVGYVCILALNSRLTFTVSHCFPLLDDASVVEQVGWPQTLISILLSVLFSVVVNKCERVLVILLPRVVRDVMRKLAGRSSCVDTLLMRSVLRRDSFSFVELWNPCVFCHGSNVLRGVSGSMFVAGYFPVHQVLGVLRALSRDDFSGSATDHDTTISYQGMCAPMCFVKSSLCRAEIEGDGALCATAVTISCNVVAGF